MRIAKAIIIFTLGIITTICIGYFGFQTIQKHSSETEKNVENDILAENTDFIKGSISDFGFRQLDPDRAETNVLYFKLNQIEKYFRTSPSLKSHFLMQEWVRKLQKGDTLQIRFLKTDRIKRSHSMLPIVEMFHKNKQILFKKDFIITESAERKHWLEKRIFLFPNLLLLIFLSIIFFLVWGFSVLGIVQKPKLY